MIDFTMSQGGKIAVHCHAGTGRTGLAIGAWLIFGENNTAEQAIKKFQTGRKGGLGKSKQKDFLYQFQKFLVDYRKSYYLNPKLTMDQIIQRQKNLIYGELRE